MSVLINNSSTCCWSVAWRAESLRRVILIGSGIFLILLVVWGPFCQYIEMRQGIVLNDWLLNRLTARDVSIPIFVVIWSVGGLTVYRICRDADMFSRMVWAYSLLFISRIVTISLVPLDAPNGLIELSDPLSNVFYGMGAPFITKDLFYSGHTSVLVLMALCLKKPPEQKMAMLGAGIVGTLLLIQHVHYTIDVVAAPFFSYAVYRIAGRITTERLSRELPRQQAILSRQSRLDLINIRGAQVNSGERSPVKTAEVAASENS